jgi:glutamate carboxypeptidase
MDTFLGDLRQLVECESPSEDLAAVARSADVVARVGTARLGVAPERIVLGGVTHLRWRLGTGPSRVLLVGHHDTVWPTGTLAAVRSPCRTGRPRARLLRHAHRLGDGVPRPRVAG